MASLLTGNQGPSIWLIRSRYLQEVSSCISHLNALLLDLIILVAQLCCLMVPWCIKMVQWQPLSSPNRAIQLGVEWVQHPLRELEWELILSFCFDVQARCTHWMTLGNLTGPVASKNTLTTLDRGWVKAGNSEGFVRWMFWINKKFPWAVKWIEPVSSVTHDAGTQHGMSAP